VLIDIEKFADTFDDPGTAMWRAFYGKVRETAENTWGVAPSVQDELRACFEVFDKDGSGRILVRKLGDVMDYLGERLSAKELRQMMEAVDINRDGTVSYLEFLSKMAGGQPTLLARGGASGGPAPDRKERPHGPSAGADGAAAAGV